jgi:hypothetical protein
MDITSLGIPSREEVEGHALENLSTGHGIAVDYFKKGFSI